MTARRSPGARAVAARMLPLLLLPLLLLPLAGCVAPAATPRDLPGPDAAPGSDRLWDGSHLEGASCYTKTALLIVPAERVQAHLPDNLTTRAAVLQEVFLRVHRCDALLLDTGPPLRDAWFYVAYVPLRNTDQAPADSVYLLEAGSDRPLLLHDLAARGVPVLEATFRPDATGITVSASGATYRVLDGAPDLHQPSSQTSRHHMLAGRPAGTHLVLEALKSARDLAYAGGVLEASGGVLGTLIDDSSPLEVTDEQVRFLLRPP